jgi:hypothetical protein
VFEPIDKDLDHPVESHWSYFKCDHSKQHFVVHRVRGYLSLKVINFIMNMQTTPHKLFLSRYTFLTYSPISWVRVSSQTILFSCFVLNFFLHCIIADTASQSTTLWGVSEEIVGSLNMG